MLCLARFLTSQISPFKRSEKCASRIASSVRYTVWVSGRFQEQISVSIGSRWQSEWRARPVSLRFSPVLAAGQ